MHTKSQLPQIFWQKKPQDIVRLGDKMDCEEYAAVKWLDVLDARVWSKWPLNPRPPQALVDFSAEPAIKRPVAETRIIRLYGAKPLREENNYRIILLDDVLRRNLIHCVPVNLVANYSVLTEKIDELLQNEIFDALVKRLIAKHHNPILRVNKGTESTTMYML